MKSYKVISNRKLTNETFVLRTERPDSKIIAGQCFSVGINSLGINREYSMYSGAEDNYIDFLIRKVDGGVISTALSTLGEGDLVEIGGPYGEFRLDPTAIKTKRFVFVSTGTGIAPFHSFCQTYPNLDYTILHGIRLQTERYDFRDYQDGRYFPFISQPQNREHKKYVSQDLFERKLLQDEIYYLCGNRNMITDCTSMLRDKGIHGDSIFTETFF